MSQLDEHDFEEIDQLLEQLSDGDGLQLDGVQGLLTAIAIGPRRVDPETWFTAVLGGQPSAKQMTKARRLYALLLRLYVDIDRSLDVFAFEPIFAETGSEDDRQVDCSGWCQGFSLGVDLNADIWEQRMNEDGALLDMLAPIVELGVEDGVFAEIADPAIPPLSDQERDERMQQLPSLLADVRHYWIDRPFEDAAPAGATLH